MTPIPIPEPLTYELVREVMNDSSTKVIETVDKIQKNKYEGVVRKQVIKQAYESLKGYYDTLDYDLYSFCLKERVLFSLDDFEANINETLEMRKFFFPE